MQLKNNKTKRLSPNNKQLVHCPGIIHVRTVFMFSFKIQKYGTTSTKPPTIKKFSCLL